MYQSNYVLDTDRQHKNKQRYYQTLTSPMSAYWENNVIGQSNHFELSIKEKHVGFYFIHTHGELICFYLDHEYKHHANSALAYIIEKHSIKKALAGTNDTHFLNLCFESAVDSEVHSLLFHDDKTLSDTFSIKNDYEFDHATKKDRLALLGHYCSFVNDKDVCSEIIDYVDALLKNDAVFILRKEKKIIATSECRISASHSTFADLGVLVNKSYRAKGLGSYILNCTKAYCYWNNLKPMCSCLVLDKSSVKTITKAGFIGRDKVFRVTF